MKTAAEHTAEARKSIRGALAALEQNKTFKADLIVAKTMIDNAQIALDYAIANVTCKSI